MMSNKPHLRPHQKERHASRITRLLVAILIVAIFALIIALEMTGRIVFRGRLILFLGRRWHLTAADRRVGQPHAEGRPSLRGTASGLGSGGGI
jgi:hypothetical protein